MQHVDIASHRIHRQLLCVHIQTDNTLLQDGRLAWEICLNFDHKSKQGPYM